MSDDRGIVLILRRKVQPATEISLRSATHGISDFPGSELAAGPSRKKPTTAHRRRRNCIIVVGMHRSGTSALTRLLSLLGCDLPKTLMKAHPTNETGHWESVAIQDLNDRILFSAGSNWRDWRALNSDWFTSAEAEGFRDQALSILETEFGASDLFVLKDPRVCRLVPFWLDVLKRAGVRVSVVSPIRNPLEVSASLRNRNDLEPSLSHLLWLRHVLDGEIGSRGVRRFFTGYDELLEDWTKVVEGAKSAIGVRLPKASPRKTAEIDAFLSHGHRHHQASVDSFLHDPALSAWLRDTFGVLNGWVQSGENPRDHATLDRIRAEFDAATPAFDRLVTHGQNAGERALDLERRLADTTEQLTLSETNASNLQQVLCRTEVELAQARQVAALRDQQLDSLQANAAERQAAYVALETDRRERLKERDEALVAAERSAELNDVKIHMLEAGAKNALAEKAAVAKSIHVERESYRTVLSHLQMAKAEAEVQLKSRTDDLVAVTRLIQHMQTEAAATLAEQSGLLRQVQSDRDERTRRAELAEQLADTRLGQFAELESRAGRAVGHAIVTMAKTRSQRALLPTQSTLNKQIALIVKSRLFDAAWYLRRYEDVAKAGMDPLKHYLLYGAKEGRLPNGMLLEDENSLPRES